ncbi:MAG: tRNA uridine(34) 5-carboxymethylaminomethyl modification radical SAM/GNAT enzyme Elp3 [Candidatus Pacebacteria bacterium]|nr:tRNA uridine(34) 5-carboxymethylaminomethyl modification radical SAM/GNAT enzyme Elp3 [Candidatus Paceibacterota bacterium]
MPLDELILTLISQKPKSKQELEELKKRFAKSKTLPLPKHYRLLKNYHRLLKTKKIKRQIWLEKLLLTKPIRTLSGVTPLTVLTKPYPCPGKCLYCPDQRGIPKSYLSDEPAVLRACQFDFDAAEQVKCRLRVFELMGHRVAKIELIVLGGSFSFYPRTYREKFIRNCFEAANRKKSETLLESQRQNETAKRRIIGLTVETRPDLIDEKEIVFLRQLGVTRVELGIQSLDPLVLEENKRGHNIGAMIKATRLLRNAGFKVCYHLMPGLPGSTALKDLAMFEKVFDDPHFRPDYLKIYPCVVLEDAPLYQRWQEGKFIPLTDQELIGLLIKIKKIIPPYVRINRLGRDIPLGNVVAGYRYSHLRELVQKELKRGGLVCQCIRCREIRDQKLLVPGVLDLQLKITKYAASRGLEYFLQFVDSKNRLYALLRLRFPPKNLKILFLVLKKTALIRELHVYGRSLEISEKGREASQHQGLGKKLLKKAEALAREAGFVRLAVIAGIGAREYYLKSGYQLRETYMVKNL